MTQCQQSFNKTTHKDKVFIAGQLNWFALDCTVVRNKGTTEDASSSESSFFLVIIRNPLLIPLNSSVVG